MLYNDYFTPEYILDSVFKDMILQRLQDLKPNLGSEVLFDFNLPSSKSEEEIDAAILNTFLDLQSLKGIQYYSYRRSKYRDFILESYRVASQKDKKPVEDLTVSTITKKTVAGLDGVFQYDILGYRKDSSFGSGIQQFSIFHDTNSHEFYLYMTNLNTIFYQGFLPIGDPKSMSLNVIVKREGSEYKGYIVVGVKTDGVPIKSLRKRVAISLMYRLYSIGEWFKVTLPQWM